MVAQYKILRVLKLIGLLKSRSKSISQLADSLETTTRTIYRYLELLEEVGFIVDKDFHNRYFIHTEEESRETEFTNEEAGLVKELIQSGARGHPLQETLLKKLYLNSDLKTISQNLLKARLGILVDRLGQAIREERLVVLRNYHSAHSDQISDRKVEPIYLTPNFDDYELARITDTPERVHVHIVDSNEKPTGVGEPPVPPIACAMRCIS